MAKKNKKTKRSKIVVYVFLFKKNTLLKGQKVGQKFELKGDDLWGLISKDFPENYLPEDQYFQLNDGTVVLGATQKTPSSLKKVIPIIDFVKIIKRDDFDTLSFQLLDEKFIDDFINFIKTSSINFKPEKSFLVIEKVSV
jgi:hypothetical protein